MVASRAFARRRRDVLLSVERGCRYPTACHPSGNPAKHGASMITEEKSPMRVLFFRDLIMEIIA
jgi:hypothetical protein